ncbi:hypothetical protein C2S52_017356 [Perilla frutescens var. hirtella]|nr:hypothetical protein C2S52_017356 [Perilla frutescens var. hirtella]
MAKTRGKKVAPKAGPKARLDFETPAVSEEPSPTKVVKRPSVKPKGKAVSEAAMSSKHTKETPPEKEAVPEEEEATEAPAQKLKKGAEKKKAKKPVRFRLLCHSELDKYLNEIEDIEAEPQPEKVPLFEEEEEAPADIKKRALEKAKGKRKIEPSVPSQTQAGSEEPSEDSSSKRKVGKSVGMKAGAKLAGEASSQKRKAEEGISASMPKRGRGVGSPTPSKPSSGPPPVRGIINSKGVHRETLATLGIEQEKEEYVDAVTVVPDSAEGVDAKWVDIGDGSVFQSGSTKGYCLNNDALRFCHRVLAYNFFGRKDSSNSITNQELYNLWCMVHKIKINFGFVAIAHFREIKTHPRHRISCAQLITQIAVRYRLLDLHETDLTPLPREYFDLNCLRRMQDVVDDGDGKSVFFVPGADPSSMLLAIAGTSKKPPAGKAPQREHPVAVITRRLELIENAQFQTNEKLTRIEAALKAYFKHVGFSYPTPATD